MKLTEVGRQTANRVLENEKAAGGIRTLDLRITNASLYRLSYSGVSLF
jgi:hypothetical protein